MDHFLSRVKGIPDEPVAPLPAAYYVVVRSQVERLVPADQRSAVLSMLGIEE
jgi:hypothetical protein